VTENLSDAGWTTITVSIPPEVAAIGVVPDIQRFVDAMIYKIRRNCHKGHWNSLTLEQATEDLRGEVAEFEGALKSGSTMEILMEAADVANEAMIAANIALEARGV
jgi:hypothetical protein